MARRTRNVGSGSRFWVAVAAVVVAIPLATLGVRAAEPPAAPRVPQVKPDRRTPPGPPLGRGPGMGRGRMQDERFVEDHNVFFYLLDHRDQIRRKVTDLPNGIETVTESDDAAVAAKIQEHVAAMYDRVENVHPIHMRDPLFREIFAHAKKISLKMTETDKGVRVTETSDDPYVAKLLQAHARVVSLFIQHGRPELHRNHALPHAIRRPNNQRTKRHFARPARPTVLRNSIALTFPRWR